jgi:polyhydroxybutyrate depolymerase
VPLSTTAEAGARRAVVALLALPLAVTLILAVSFEVRNRTNGVLVSSGIEREYLLHVPKAYDPARPTPLVISLHGGAMWPAAHMETSRWNAVADAYGFLVAYPAGSGSGRMRFWRMGSGPGGQAEVRFISDLIDALQARYNIDSRRVYADGLSNGGGMAFVLSCTLSDRIAAVGLVGSAQLLPWEWCTDERPVPMVNFHGTEDRFTPYQGGESPVAPNPFPDVSGWTARWARRNRCAARALESRVAPDVTRLEYSGCADDASVVLYTVHGGGHTWPGGEPLPEWFAGRTSNGVSASLEAWRFFSAHPLRADKGGERLDQPIRPLGRAGGLRSDGGDAGLTDRAAVQEERGQDRGWGLSRGAEEVDLEHRGQVDDVERSSSRDRVAHPLVGDVELAGQLTNEWPGVLGKELSHHVGVDAGARYAVGGAGHRARDVVTHAEPLQGLDDGSQVLDELRSRAQGRSRRQSTPSRAATPSPTSFP